jgi:hypothetical protein
MSRPKKKAEVSVELQDALQVVQDIKIGSKEEIIPSIENAFYILCLALDFELEDDEPALEDIERAREMYGEPDSNSWSIVINLLQGVVGKTFLTY